MFGVSGIWPCEMNHVSMCSGRGLFVKYVVLYSWEVCISHSCTQYMCWLIIRKDIHVLWTESTSAGVIWVGQGQGRTRLACWLLLLMKSAELRTGKLQNIFLNPLLRSNQSKEISNGPTKPGQIRTTRSSKLITSWSWHGKCGRELSDFVQVGNCWRVVAVLVLNHTHKCNS